MDPELERESAHVNRLPSGLNRLFPSVAPIRSLGLSIIHYEFEGLGDVEFGAHMSVGCRVASSFSTG